MNGALRVAIIVVCAFCAATVPPATLHAQPETAPAGQTLDTLESVLGWPAPDTELLTDVRVMTRSRLAFVPLPLVRLTGGDDDQLVATVTEWGSPEDRRPDGRPMFFKYLPLECSDDGELCAGTPRVIDSPEVKALWFALFIARSCNDRPRKVISDAEDLFVRGRVRGIPMQFSCTGPNPRGPSPGDRQAAAVLRITHRLLGR